MKISVKLRKLEAWYVLNRPKSFLSAIRRNALKDYILRKRKIAFLTQTSCKQIDKFYDELYSKKDLINYLLTIHENQKVFGTTLTPLRAPVIYVICRALKPQIIVETGAGSGVSSTFILQALEDNSLGTLWSIDFPVGVFQIKPPGWLIPSHLRRRWSLVIGKSSEKLEPLLRKLVNIDLFFHDSEHTFQNMLREYTIAWHFIRPGGILISDDIIRNDAFSDFCKSTSCSAVTFDNLGCIRKPRNWPEG